MIFGTLKYIALFGLSFFILCIPIKNKELFYHIKTVANPLVEKGLDESGKAIKKGYKATKNYAKELFVNNRKDSVKTRQSGTTKKANKNYHRETYSDHDQENLERIIEEH